MVILLTLLRKIIKVNITNPRAMVYLSFKESFSSGFSNFSLPQNHLEYLLEKIAGPHSQIFSCSRSECGLECTFLTSFQVMLPAAGWGTTPKKTSALAYVLYNSLLQFQKKVKSSLSYDVQPWILYMLNTILKHYLNHNEEGTRQML